MIRHFILLIAAVTTMAIISLACGGCGGTTREDIAEINAGGEEKKCEETLCSDDESGGTTVTTGTTDISIDSEDDGDVQPPGDVDEDDPVVSVEEDVSGYCGDEPYFKNEQQAAVAVAAENATNHNLLPPIVVNITGDLDIDTITSDAMRFSVGGASTDEYDFDVEQTAGGAKITLTKAAGKKAAWQPSASYSLKLCHQIKTNAGKPIKPIAVTVTTHKPNQQENIGLYHSNNTRSGAFYLPANYDPSQDYPLALVLHGLGGNGSGMVSDFQALADSMGVILLGPDGFIRPNPLGSGTLYYFNPNFINTEVQDYTFVASCLDKMLAAFGIDENHILVAGMSMGAPATLFLAGENPLFTHAAMLHGIRLNYDPSSQNDVANLVYGFEVTPIGTKRPKFWYSTAVNDWVTNYLFVDNYLSGMSPAMKDFIKNFYGFKLSADLNYVESAYGGTNVTHKFDYGASVADPYASHQIFPDEKEDLFNWFLYGILP